MEINDVIPRLGDERFLSFSEISGCQQLEDNWLSSLMHIGHWRQADSLRGATVETIEGDDIKILQSPDGSNGLKLSIPKQASQGEIERALHVLITMNAIRAKLVSDVTGVNPELAMDTEAREQIANVLKYESVALKDIPEQDAEQLRPHYEQYGEQVTKVILAVRDYMLSACPLCEDTGKLNS